MTLPFEIHLPEGATPLDPNETEGLRLKHISTMKELDEAEAAGIAKAHLWLLRHAYSGPTWAPIPAHRGG